MRKVLSFVLVLSLVLGSFGFAFAVTPAATPSDVKGTEFETAVNVLANLEVATGYPDGTFKPEGAVTRGEMSAFIVRELGLTSSADYMNASSFSDMKGHWADKYVAVIAGKGVVNGYPDGTFRPDEKVSFPEAITMIVRALGYIDGCSSLVGNWPVNYVSLASDLDITDDVKVILSGSADRGAVAIMLYNALTVANVSVNNDGEVKEKGTEDNRVTFISKLDCYLDKGEDGDGIQITPDMVRDEDKSLIDLSQYAYAYVDVYRLDDGDDDPIIAVNEIRSDVVKGKIDIDTEEGGGFDTTTIKQESGKEIDVPSLDIDNEGYTHKWKDLDTGELKDIMVFLNGEEVKYKNIKWGSDLLDCWNVTLYGELDGDEVINVHGVVASALTSGWLVDENDLNDIEDAIEDGNGTVMDIELPTVDNDEEELDLDDIKVVGDAKSLEEVEENDVVFIYASGNKAEPDKVTFEVARSTKEITVKEASSDTKAIYDKDGNKYQFSGWMVNYGSYNKMGDKFPAYYDDDLGFKGFRYIEEDDTWLGTDDVYSDFFEPGDTYKLFIDPWGYVYGAEEVDTTADNYGIVVALESCEGIGDPRIELFTNEGDTSVFDVDVDDVANDSILDGKTWETDVITYGSIVEYSTDSSGKIDELNVLNLVTDEGAYIGDDYSSKSEKWNGETVGSACVIFDIEGDANFGASTQKDSGWDVLSGLKDDVVYEAKYYQKDGESDEDIVLMLINKKSEIDHEYFAVNMVSKIKDGDKDKYKISGFFNGVEDSKVTKNRSVLPEEKRFEGFVYIITSSGIEVSDVDIIRTGAAIVQGPQGDYGKVSDVDKNSLEGVDFADDVVVYIQEYKDGEPDRIEVGEVRDIDENDFAIWLYDDDGDIELVVLVDEEDYDDYIKYMKANSLN